MLYFEAYIKRLRFLYITTTVYYLEKKEFLAVLPKLPRSETYKFPLGFIHLLRTQNFPKN